MKQITVRILCVIFLCMMNLTIIAQSDSRTIRLFGFVMDSFTEYGLEKAKITLMTRDSLVIDTASVRSVRPSGYMVSSSYSFDVPAKLDTYIIKAECEGYIPAVVSYTLKHVARVKQQEIPALKLVKLKSRHSLTGENELGEVTVRATKIKFYHKGDTLVYNADAFNLP